MSFEIKDTFPFRTRYSRPPNSKQPKNTLVTTQIGDKIYFGIARCNLRADNTAKKIGRFIAHERMNLALTVEQGHLTDVVHVTENTSLFFIMASGLSGIVDIDRVKDLLKYFEDIDNIQKKDASGDGEILY